MLVYSCDRVPRTAEDTEGGGEDEEGATTEPNDTPNEDPESFGEEEHEPGYDPALAASVIAETVEPFTLQRAPPPKTEQYLSKFKALKVPCVYLPCEPV